MNFLRTFLRTEFLLTIRRHVMTKVDGALAKPALTSQMHITTSELKKDGDALAPDVKAAGVESSTNVFAGKMTPDKLSPDKALAILKDKWAELEMKLPVWQGKIADGMQCVQDFITSRFIK